MAQVSEIARTDSKRELELYFGPQHLGMVGNFSITLKVEGDRVLTATANPASANQPDPVRLAGRTARAFLGMRIDCLQCHDDKLGNVEVGSEDDLHSGTQANFHELAAFFGSAEIKLRSKAKDDYEEVPLDEVVAYVRELLSEIRPIYGGV